MVRRGDGGGERRDEDGGGRIWSVMQLVRVVAMVINHQFADVGYIFLDSASTYYITSQHWSRVLFFISLFAWELS